jgi:hypothetical protein
MGAGQGAARFAEEEEGWIRAAGKGGGRGASPVVAAAARPGSGRGERERESRGREAVGARALGGCSKPLGMRDRGRERLFCRSRCRHRWRG